MGDALHDVPCWHGDGKTRFLFKMNYNKAALSSLHNDARRPNEAPCSRVHSKIASPTDRAKRAF